MLKMTSAVLAALLACVGVARAVSLTVYGGPTYDNSTSTGYAVAPVYDGLNEDVNNAGTGVGHVTRYDAGTDKGLRAVRWNASGTTVQRQRNWSILALAHRATRTRWPRLSTTPARP